jgi:hypothetical protein
MLRSIKLRKQRKTQSSPKRSDFYYYPLKFKIMIRLVCINYAVIKKKNPYTGEMQDDDKKK